MKKAMPREISSDFQETMAQAEKLIFSIGKCVEDRAWSDAAMWSEDLGSLADVFLALISQAVDAEESAAEEIE